MNIVIYKMVNSNLLSVLKAVFGVEAEARSGEVEHDSNESGEVEHDSNESCSTSSDTTTASESTASGSTATGSTATGTTSGTAFRKWHVSWNSSVFIRIHHHMGSFRSNRARIASHWQVPWVRVARPPFQPVARLDRTSFWQRVGCFLIRLHSIAI
jgi:hypothetical protein